MSEKHSHLLSRRSRRSLIATLVALSFVLFTTLSAFANTVNISDRAGILDANRVSNEGSSLADRLDIYTTSNFSGSTTALNQEAIRSIPNPNSIVMVISTNLQYISIVGGRSVGMSNSQYTNAANSFISDYKSHHDYTSATIAAIGSLRSALGGSGAGGIVQGVGSIFSGGTLCCVGLLVIAGIALFAFVRRRSSGGFFNRARFGSNYNQPYNQGGYPPNYGPGPNQGGMNPWAAGGLGAAAGGLVGYELGKEAGERDGDNDGGNFGGGDFGGGGGGNFGGDGGNGGDFGGGGGGSFGGDNSGGGDFGGGGGGNF